MKTPVATTFLLQLLLLLLQESEGSVVRRLDILQEKLQTISANDVTLDDRLNCTEGDVQPPNRVDTAERVARLRQEMANYGLDAYLILTDDEHQNEYVSPADMRLDYISGFSGSWGIVAVTMEQQAVWVDGRYFLQADDQLDCHWLLMKTGLEGVPSTTEWLKEVMWEGARVGSDPKIMTATAWMDYTTILSDSGIIMVAESTNLVDIIWTDRPSHSTDPAFVLPLQFAGISWEEKVQEVRVELNNVGASTLVVSALDEVAWLLNLRGNDIPYNPVFRGYVLLGQDRIQLFTPSEKIATEVEDHLHSQQCSNASCVQIFDYETIEDSLQALEDDPSVSTVLVNPSGSSYSIYNAIPSDKRFTGSSPIIKLKAIKNPIEIQGMRNAHLKDAVALCDFLAQLESEVTAGVYWDELSAAELSEEFRGQQEDFIQLSFATISAFGPNGAIIHYEPSNETNLQVDTTSLYLLDSGAQFLDGTTDITRTLHFGSPSQQQVEAYTRVLQGHIDFANAVFPASAKTSVADIEILARRYLYDVGLDYRHGTSHGVGMFLYVHEATPSAFEIGEFISDEPGFYYDGEFGIRLENVIEVVQMSTPCSLLNDYHSRVRMEVGQEMLNQGRQEGYEWLLSKTDPVSC